MVIQTETDWYNLCFRHRRPPVSKYASSRGKQISSRGRVKWTFKKKKCLTVSAFIPNEILVLEQNFILVHANENERRSDLKIANRVVWSAYLIWRGNHESQNALGYELPFRTTVILVWKSFQYHVKSWGLDHFMNTNITVGKNDFVT